MEFVWIIGAVIGGFILGWYVKATNGPFETEVIQSSFDLIKEKMDLLRQFNKVTGYIHVAELDAGGLFTIKKTNRRYAPKTLEEAIVQQQKIHEDFVKALENAERDIRRPYQTPPTCTPSRTTLGRADCGSIPVGYISAATSQMASSQQVERPVCKGTGLYPSRNCNCDGYWLERPQGSCGEAVSRAKSGGFGPAITN